MPSLSRQQFLGARNLSPENLRQQRFQGQLALAFGQVHPVKPDRFRELDLAAGFLRDEFAGHLSGKIAAMVVLWWWDLWLDGIRRAGHEKRYGCLFAVGRRDVPGRGPLLFVSSGTALEIQADYAELPDDEKPPSAHFVDLWAALQAVRADAERAGVRLSDPLVPYDPLYEQIITQASAIRLELMRRDRARGWEPRPPPQLPASLERLIDRVTVH
jgi:hypothetical protein